MVSADSRVATITTCSTVAPVACVAAAMHTMNSTDLPSHTSSGSRGRSRSPYVAIVDVLAATGPEEDDHAEGHGEGKPDLPVPVLPPPTPACPPEPMQVLKTNTHAVHMTMPYKDSHAPDTSKFEALVRRGSIVPVSVRQATGRQWVVLKLPRGDAQPDDYMRELTDKASVFGIAILPDGARMLVMKTTKTMLPFADKVTQCWGTKARCSSARGHDQLVGLLEAVPLLGAECLLNYVITKFASLHTPHGDHDLPPLAAAALPLAASSDHSSV